jgi:hypothetical protein
MQPPQDYRKISPHYLPPNCDARQAHVKQPAER